MHTIFHVLLFDHTEEQKGSFFHIAHSVSVFLNLAHVPALHFAPNKRDVTKLHFITVRMQLNTGKYMLLLSLLHLHVPKILKMNSIRVSTVVYILFTFSNFERVRKHDHIHLAISI